MTENKDYEVIYDGNTMQFLYHKLHNSIELTFKGGVTRSEEYRAASQAALKYATQYQVKIWLLDQKEMNVHPNDLQWLFQEWQPELSRKVGGGRRSAVIVAKNLYGEYATKWENQRIDAESDESIRIVKFFETREEAKEWLYD